MAQDVVEPRNLSALPAPFRTPQKSEKKRLNWLSWMRKSLGGKKKLCACGFYHHHDKDQEWPVFTTQMSSQSAAHNGPDHGNPCTVGLSSSSASPPNSPISDHGGSRLLLPLRPIHLARSRCHSGNGETSEVLYTRLKRSCSLNSAASGSNMEAGGASETTETIASVASITEDNEEGVYPHNHFSQDELLDDGAARNSSQIGGTVDQQDEEGRIMVNLEAIEVVSNLDEARLLGTTNDHSGGSAGSMSMTGSNAGDGTSNSSSSSSSSMMSTSSKCLSKFSSPFKRNKKNKAKNSATSSLATASSSSSDQENAKVADFEQLLLAPDNSHREEMLRLFILKLDEEANYFQVSASPEEELCDCQKCQIYYCEYYEKYLEEYERRRLMMMNENSASAAAAAMAASSAASGSPYDASNNAALVAGNVEASILMDDIMNNGMTFCSIM